MAFVPAPTSGVVITGGGSGIGRASAFALAEVGRPVAIWDVDADKAIKVAAAVTEASGVAAVGLELDVRDTAAFPAAIATSREAIGPLGGLVHSAGVTGTGPVDSLDTDVWDDTLAIHLKAAAMLIRDLLPDLESTAESAIVLISSIEGIIGHEAIPSYCAAKAGMLGLTRSTAALVGRRGIRANAICPGFVETPMFLPAVSTPERRSAFEDRIPLGRLGRPEDIAHTVRFLLSTDAAYITAAEIVVDGGVTKTTF
jgi:NAD(P)-dependent dehydrogenase (short-subunit alcohol dehydrogenase family)